jgi:plasmid stabilization system protein ParE
MLFLRLNNPRASMQSHSKIMQSFRLLEKQPEISRPCENDPMLHELIIESGDRGYITLYKIDLPKNIILILEFRHQKEVVY